MRSALGFIQRNVIPAKAGIQTRPHEMQSQNWIPACAGMTSKLNPYNEFPKGNAVKYLFYSVPTV